jgi:hypothetical protein
MNKRKCGKPARTVELKFLKVVINGYFYFHHVRYGNLLLIVDQQSRLVLAAWDELGKKPIGSAWAGPQ